MPNVTRATTPGILLTIADFDASAMNVYVTISQGANRQVTLTGDRLEVQVEQAEGGYTTAIEFRLTQQETLKLGTGAAEVQVRFINEDGLALATEIGKVSVNPILYEKVIKYE